MRSDSFHDEPLDDVDPPPEGDADTSVEQPTSRAERRNTRKRLEELFEERRLKRAIEDDWELDDDE